MLPMVKKTYEITDNTKSEQNLSAYTLKKKMAIQFAQTLHKNGTIVDQPTFVRQLVAYSRLRGIKNITKLNVSDIDACMSVFRKV
jgi:hypothetical protein